MESNGAKRMSIYVLGVAIGDRRLRLDDADGAKLICPVRECGHDASVPYL